MLINHTSKGSPFLCCRYRASFHQHHSSAGITTRTQQPPSRLKLDTNAEPSRCTPNAHTSPIHHTETRMHHRHRGWSSTPIPRLASDIVVRAYLTTGGRFASKSTWRILTTFCVIAIDTRNEEKTTTTTISYFVTSLPTENSRKCSGTLKHFLLSRVNLGIKDKTRVLGVSNVSVLPPQNVWRHIMTTYFELQ